jgi:hypothetical protein
MSVKSPFELGLKAAALPVHLEGLVMIYAHLEGFVVIYNMLYIIININV